MQLQLFIKKAARIRAAFLMNVSPMINECIWAEKKPEAMINGACIYLKMYM